MFAFFSKKRRHSDEFEDEDTGVKKTRCGSCQGCSKVNNYMSGLFEGEQLYAFIHFFCID